MGLISRVSSRTYRNLDPQMDSQGAIDEDGDDPGGGSGGRQPDQNKKQSQIKSGPGSRTNWLNTMEILIDNSVLTWDENGLILMAPENDSELIEALKTLESQWKNPLVNFKKNMSNYLFKRLDGRRLAYTNPYYNREFRHDSKKMEAYLKRVKDKMRTENMKKRKRNESSSKSPSPQ